MTLMAKNDFVFVTKVEKTMEGMIYIPEMARERAQMGMVISCGPGKYDDDGVFQPTTVKKGDMVIYNNYLWTDVDLDGKVVTVIKESDIYGILEQ